MFGMSWTQIIMIVVIGVFLLGPERIPTAVQWVTGSLKKMRGMAQGAQQQLNSELGPEIAEMRRQIAELQGLKEMQSLKELRDLNPRAMITKTIFGTDEAKTAGGVAGLLGLDPSLLSDPNVKGVSQGGPAEVTARAAEAEAVSFDKGSASPGPTVSDPLPLVGGAQEQVKPAAQPDPMPQVGDVPDPVTDPVQHAAQDPARPAVPDALPSPAAEPTPQSDVLPTAAAPGSDPLPRVGVAKTPEIVPVPSAAPTPAAATPAAAVPAAAPAAATPAPAMPAADPVPAPVASGQAGGSRWSGPVPDLQPLVVGGDPLPRIRTPDPLPTAGS